MGAPWWGDAYFGLDFINGRYVIDGARVEAAALDFSRADTAVVDYGGQRWSFANDEPRIANGYLTIDDGVTNLLTSPEDHSTGWTNDRVTVGAPGGGTVPFYPVLETTANGTHDHRRTISSTAQSLLAIFRIRAGLGRNKGRIQVLNNNASSSGVRIRFDLSGDGSIVLAAGIGASAGTVVASSLEKQSDDVFVLTVVATLANAGTSILIYESVEDDSGNSSYTGDAAKGLYWGPTLLAAVADARTYDSGTRETETLTVPLPAGNYITLIEGDDGEVLGTHSAASAEDYAIEAPGNLRRVTRARAYVAEVYDDTSSRGDTTDGDLGTRTDGGEYTLLKYSGTGALMEPATEGRIEDGFITITPQAGNDGTLYAVVDLGEGNAAAYAAAGVRFVAATGVGTLTNTSWCILFSPSLTNLIEHIPVHIVGTKSGITIQYRDGSGFQTLGSFLFAVGNSDSNIYDVSVARHNDVLAVTWRGRTVVVQDEAIREACRYAAFEIQTTSDNTTGLAELEKPVVSTSRIGDTPEYTAAAPVNTSLPTILGPYTAGTLLSVNDNSLRGNWESNAGPISFTYQWAFNGADVPGATNSTFQTTDGADEGKTVTCRVTATNDVGSTSATSTSTTALT